MSSATGTTLAGSLIATSMLRTLAEKGILGADDVAAIMNRAIDAVRNAPSADERAAFDVLTALNLQLHS